MNIKTVQNSQVRLAKIYLAEGDKAQERAITGKNSNERRASLRGLIRDQKATYQICEG